MDSVLVKFEEGFVSVEQDLMVLIGPSPCQVTKDGKYISSSIYFMAAVNVKTGELIEKSGRLVWKYKSAPWIIGNKYHFKGMKVYQVRVRESINRTQKIGSLDHTNTYLLVNAVKSSITDDRLENIKKKNPNAVEIPGVGIFELDPRSLEFEGTIDWMGSKIDVSLETDSASHTAKSALDTLKQLQNDMELWNQRFNDRLLEDIQPSTDAWNEEEIPKDEFLRRIGTPIIHISEDGGLEIVYGDDDMFGGHMIVLYGSISDGITDSDIEG